MGYREIYKEGNENAQERRLLVTERLREIPAEHTVPEVFQPYFSKTAEYLLFLDDILSHTLNDTLRNQSLEEHRERNHRLYEDILPQNYSICYGRPSYAAEQFGQEAGSLLCFLYSELQAGIGYVFEGRAADFVTLCELYIQIYNCFEQEDGPDLKEAKKAVYWYFHDYSEIFALRQVQEMVDPDFDFCTDIIMNSDLNDPRYLYFYGLPVGENELRTAEYLSKMPEEKIQAMADTWTEGYRIGFEVTGKDIGKKKSVSLHYALGFERMVRAAVKNFEAIGLRPTIAMEAQSSFFNKGGAKRGAYSTSVNRQFDYDHREDKAFYFDKSFVERRLEALHTAFEQYRKQAEVFGGPAVMETFGEQPFAPESDPAAIRYQEKQQQLNVYNASMSGKITNEYIRGEERSFTIIAYPVPAIGEKFDEIFAETVKINTLDYKTYQRIQQKLIDVLDTAEKVEIRGRGGNRTDLTVAIRQAENPQKETVFENCVADVNIPVGEVFTSPVLKGTEGILHVSEVFLNGLQYRDLELVFHDGMVSDCRCGNFESEEEGRRYIHDNVLMHHDTLPMGEFAIGTNTAAYRMGRRYKIMDRLPILIAEKCGPHFAVGDTCYSHAEDTKVYNPDGKEIISRDNEISLLRREDPQKAYFNCHTDITIPYDELDSITAVRRDGERIPVIRNGRFAVPGTEELNVALDED